MIDQMRSADTPEDDLFMQWLKLEEGRYWIDEDKMPPGAGEAIGIFNDRSINHGPNDPEAIEAAKRFEQITGYSPKAFNDYRHKLDARLKK